MRIHFSVVGNVDPFDDVWVDLPAVPRQGDTVALTGLPDSLANVRHVEWYPQGDQENDPGSAPFVYVVLGPALPS